MEKLSAVGRRQNQDAIALGVHPAEKVFHELSFYCDDIHATIAELTGRGAEFEGGVEEDDWGFHILIRAPGGPDVLLYQLKYSK